MKSPQTLSTSSSQKPTRDNPPLFTIHYLLSIFYASPPASGFILAVYTLLTLGLTYPLIFNLSAAVPNDIGDPLLNTWILAWDGHALLTDPLNLFKANIFYPLPNTLAYSEHLFSTALLALPLQLISAEPVVAYNLSLLATFPLAALGMYLLALRWTGQRSAAFIAGLIFAFAPYRFAAIAHLQLLTCQWLPFILLYLDKILDPRRPAPSMVYVLRGSVTPARRSQTGRERPHLAAPILLIFLLLQLLASWYLALYTLVIVSVYLLARLLAGRVTRPMIGPSPWLLLISTFLISILLALPFAWPYLDLLDELRAARPLSMALSLAAQPTDFAAAAPFNRLFGPLTAPLRTRPGFTEENTLFVGFIAPLLALISVITIVAPVGSSMWPGFQITRTPHPVSPITPDALRLTLYALLLTLLLALTLTFPTPYAAVANLIPPSTIIRVPARWLIPALFGLAGLAAFGYTVITHPATHHTPYTTPTTFLNSSILAAAATLLLLETFSAPLPLAPIDNRASLNPAYRWLAAQPGDMALIELPLHSAPAPEYPEVKRLYASTLGWWRLVNGYSGYTPPRQPRLAQALADFPGPESLAALQNLTSPATAASPHLRVPASPPLFLLVHPGEAPFDRSRWENESRWQVERNPAFRPIGQFEGDYLYQVFPPDPARFAAPPLAAFGPAQTIQLLAYEVSIANPKSKIQNPGEASKILLYWRAAAPPPADYTIFIHFRAADGFVRSQADGPPVGGHYPATSWQSGEIIQDIHPWPEVEPDQVDHVAVGLYDPTSGERLLAFDRNGQRLAGDALLIPLN